jgi:hypothetical protein
MGETLQDTGMGKGFVNKIPIAQKIRIRINKQNYIKLKAST